MSKLEFILNSLHTQHKNIIIVGDLNINFISDSPSKQQLMDLLGTYGLSPLVYNPIRITQKSQTAIDQIILNANIFSYHLVMLNTAISDHDGQKLTLYTGSKMGN